MCSIALILTHAIGSGDIKYIALLFYVGDVIIFKSYLIDYIIINILHVYKF